MPYIRQENRVFDEQIEQICDVIKRSPFSASGLVTYILYKIVKELYGAGDFDTLSNGIKVLECAKLEFARSVLAPYEDQKRLENGDV